MAKREVRDRAYVCASCERRELKWLGRCPNCGAWNSFRELDPPTSLTRGAAPQAVPLAAIAADPGLRVTTGIAELDRVLGGGLMRGSVTLVGGEPGVGKSTLLLQVACLVSASTRVMYVTAEESAAHLRLRADRLGLDAPALEVWAGTELTDLVHLLDTARPGVVIVDSIQALTTDSNTALPGGVGQAKQISDALTRWAHARNAIVILVAHVTKEGGIAGPKAIEHMVDVVLYFDGGNAELRFVRGVKNRFGSVDEIALFEMTARGLAQVKQPASRFLEHAGDSDAPPGVAVAALFEGSRVLCVEVQALVVPAQRGGPRIVSDRIDAGRVARIAAVLQRYLQLQFLDRDIYMNVAGGIRLRDVAADLPIALALYGARTELTQSGTLASFGEISLAGEVRRAAGAGRRLRALHEVGFQRVLAPEGAGSLDGLEVTPAGRVRDAVRKALGTPLLEKKRAQER